MDWNLIKKAGCKSVGGIDYDLSHLKDFEVEFEIAATKKHSEITAKMLIQYSSHCVSVGPPRGKPFNFGELGEDHLVIDDRGNKRRFCSERYEWSKHLPDIIQSLPGDRRCFFTGRKNWLSIEILNSSEVPQTRKYEVFFNLRRKSSNFLRVYVESGYVRAADDEVHRPHDFRRRDKVRGKILLAKTLRKEPINRPKGR